MSERTTSGTQNASEAIENPRHPLCDGTLEDWCRMLKSIGQEAEVPAAERAWSRWQAQGLEIALRLESGRIAESVPGGTVKRPQSLLRHIMKEHEIRAATGKSRPELAPACPQESGLEWAFGDMAWISTGAMEGRAHEWGEARQVGELHKGWPAQVMGRQLHLLIVWPTGPGMPMQFDLRTHGAMISRLPEGTQLNDWSCSRDEWKKKQAADRKGRFNQQDSGTPAAQQKERERKSPTGAQQQIRDSTLLLRCQNGGYLPGAPESVGGPPPWLKLPDPDPDVGLSRRSKAPEWCPLIERVAEDITAQRIARIKARIERLNGRPSDIQERSA